MDECNYRRKTDGFIRMRLQDCYGIFTSAALTGPVIVDTRLLRVWDLPKSSKPLLQGLWMIYIQEVGNLVECCLKKLYVLIDPERHSEITSCLVNSSTSLRTNTDLQNKPLYILQGIIEQVIQKCIITFYATYKAMEIS